MSPAFPLPAIAIVDHGAGRFPGQCMQRLGQRIGGSHGILQSHAPVAIPEFIAHLPTVVERRDGEFHTFHGIGSFPMASGWGWLAAKDHDALFQCHVVHARADEWRPHL